MSLRQLVPLIVFFLLVNSVSAEIHIFETQMIPVDQLLERQLEKGEAVIWYLGHAGWAVKTQNHFLVFDYTVPRNMPEIPSLVTGVILPSQIENENMSVFVSHAHGDHFDRGILEWVNSLNRIKFFFGWQADGGTRSIDLDLPREELSMDGLDIITIHHEFDGLLEAAFLLEVDGLVIFHSGDHGTTGESMNPLFKDNIDYLSSRKDKVDIAFISMFGSRSGAQVNSGDLYTLEKMKPQAAFPMHQGGGERFYKIFVQEAKDKGVKTRILAAEKEGDYFIYKNGTTNKGDTRIK